MPRHGRKYREALARIDVEISPVIRSILWRGSIVYEVISTAAFYEGLSYFAEVHSIKSSLPVHIGSSISISLY